MKHISTLLENGRVVGIFPEGGVNPQLQDAIARGERVNTAVGNLVRDPLELVHARPGTAFMALRHKVRILPVAVLGTEHTKGKLNPFNRIPITIRFGKPFGPLFTIHFLLFTFYFSRPILPKFNLPLQSAR